jgi:hypothetical protein
MISLYDELSGRLATDPSLTKRGGPRYDLGLLLFDFRDPMRGLWHAAADEIAAAAGAGRAAAPALAAAVEKLRPLFGERSGR